MHHGVLKKSKKEISIRREINKNRRKANDQNILETL